MSILQAQLKSLLPKRHFARSVAILAGGTALGQALTMLAAPILTRLYTPGDYGVLAVYTSILSIIVVIVGLRYELAIPLPEDDVTAASLLVLSIVTVAGMCLLVGVGLWVFGDQVMGWFNAAALKPNLWLLPLSLLGAGVYQALSYWAVRRQAFPQIARTKLSQSVGGVLTKIGLGLLHVGPAGLLIGDTVGRVTGSGFLARLAWQREGEILRRVTIGSVRWAAFRYCRFPLFSSVSSLINSAGLYITPLLLASFYGTKVAGQYALGDRIVGVPLFLVGQAVAQVYLGEASRMMKEHPEELKRLFLRTAQRLLLLCILPMGILGLSGPWIFGWLFGIEWQEAGMYVQLLAPAFLLRFVAYPLAQTLNLLEKQDWQLAWDISRLLLVVGSLFLAHHFEWTPLLAIATYSGVLFIAYGAILLFNIRAVSEKKQQQALPLL